MFIPQSEQPSFIPYIIKDSTSTATLAAITTTKKNNNNLLI
jgi:hypothetical protein